MSEPTHFEIMTADMLATEPPDYVKAPGWDHLVEYGFAYSRGAYARTCNQCGRHFSGDKRAPYCYPCAVKHRDASQAEPKWLVEARCWVRQRGDTCLVRGNMIIHEVLDKLCWAEDWNQVDRIISWMEPETENLDLLVSVLMVTHPLIRILQNRAAFYDACYPRLSVAMTTPGALDRLGAPR